MVSGIYVLALVVKPFNHYHTQLVDLFYISILVFLSQRRSVTSKIKKECKLNVVVFLTSVINDDPNLKNVGLNNKSHEPASCFCMHMLNVYR